MTRKSLSLADRLAADRAKRENSTARKSLSLADRLAADRRKRENSPWVVAGNGEHENFIVTPTGSRLIRCVQPATGKHAYLNHATGKVLSDKEVLKHLGI